MIYDGLAYTGTKVRPGLDMKHKYGRENAVLIFNGFRSSSWGPLWAVQTGKPAQLILHYCIEAHKRPLVRAN